MFNVLNVYLLNMFKGFRECLVVFKKCLTDTNEFKRLFKRV